MGFHELLIAKGKMDEIVNLYFDTIGDWASTMGLRSELDKVIDRYFMPAKDLCDCKCHESYKFWRTCCGRAGIKNPKDEG